MPGIRLPGGGELYSSEPGRAEALTREQVLAIERARDAATPEGLRLGAALAATRREWRQALLLLDEAARRGAVPAIVANDRAAIALAAATAGADPLGLVTALTASDEAVRKAPSDATATAWRNRALILDRLELASSARAAWARYLAAAGPQAPRRAEAQRRLHRLFVDYGRGSCWEQATRWRSWLANPASGGEPSLAGEDTQALRLFVEDELLPAWADARLEGATPRATALGEVAIALARRITASGGDPLTLEIASRAVASELPGARAVQAYGRSRSAFRELRYEEAARGFAEAARPLTATSNPALLRARGYRAAALARLNRAQLAELELRELHETSRPSIRAYAADQLASLYVKRGAPAKALPLYREAIRVAAAHHELASLATMQSTLAHALFALGKPELGVLAAEESLHTSSRSCNAYARGSAVWMAGDLLLQAGSLQAGDAFQRESLAIERAAGDPALITASLQTIALNDIRLQRPDDALSIIAEARAVSRKAASASVREGQMRFLDWIEGTAVRERDPAAAARLLAASLPVLESTGRASERTAAILSRGQALLLLGDRAGGRAELRRGVEAYERLREEVSTLGDPARAFAEAEPAFDALTASLLADGLSVEALVSSERGRRPWRTAATAVVSSSAGSPSAAVLYLDQMDDRLAVWWMRAGHLRQWQLPWKRDDSRRLTAELSRTPAKGGELVESRLAELLAPAKEDLATADRIVVIAEDAWATVPWSATAHPRGGRWIDHLVVSVAPSLGLAIREGAGVPAEVLVAADPERDVRDGSYLPPLPAARQEGKDVAAAYPRSTLLIGARASREKVLSRWRSADVLHFAVHAVVDEAMPGAARLVLSSADDGGNLTIADIAAARFPRRPLVVLSGCFTRAGRVVPLAGPMDLAREFLSSGASGVVATLRPVEDRETAELMGAFHREYVRDGDAPAALARAMRAPRITASGHSGPPDWSAFQYIGSDPQARAALPSEVETLLAEGRRR